MCHYARTEKPIVNDTHRIWLDKNIVISLCQSSRTLINVLREAFLEDESCLRMNEESRAFLFEFDGFDDSQPDAEEPLQFGLEGELLNHWDL